MKIWIIDELDELDFASDMPSGEKIVELLNAREALIEQLGEALEAVVEDRETLEMLSRCNKAYAKHKLSQK